MRARNTPAVSSSILLSVLVLLAVSVVPFAVVWGQEALSIPDRPVCPRCRIVATLQAVLGRESGYPGTFRYWPNNVMQERSGRYLAIETGGGMAGGPWEFDSRGRFVRVLGREGEGPGEFRAPMLIIRGLGDSIHVLDMMLQRMSILSPDGRYVRSNPWPVRIAASALQLPDGRYVVSARFGAPARSMKPLHFVSPDGEHLSSFAFEESMDPGSERWIRLITRGADGTLWTATWSHRYRLEHWSPEGRLLEVFEPQRAWFRPFDQTPMPSPTQPPAPMLAAIWYDSTTDFLWVTSVVVDPRWREGIGPLTRSREGLEAHEIVNPDRVYDGVVEIYDMKNRQLYAAGRFDRPFRAGFGNLMAERFEEEAGLHVVGIYRLELAR